jgi:hypothetical protein
MPLATYVKAELGLDYAFANQVSVIKLIKRKKLFSILILSFFKKKKSLKYHQMA